jgi:crotonobetainyl-CoA:carnitine CoA-transferase CaiB-like acyl-CoA transferase
MLNDLVLGEPRYLPTVVCDKTTAMAVVQGVTAALFHREKTGRGQEIEIPMFETMVSFIMAEHLWGYTFEPPLGEPGYTRLMSHHRKPYKTKDGFIAILPYLDSHWEIFCKLSNRLDLLNDERFESLSQRVKNIDDTYQETAKTMLNKTTKEWLEIFGNTSVPTISVNNLKDLIHDNHLKQTGFWKEIAHPTEGALRTPAFPINFSDSPASIRRHQPNLGEHSKEILLDAGISESELENMLLNGSTKTSS